MDAVSVIEKHNGGQLSKGLRNTVDDYAVEVLGSKVYAPWLYVYALIRGGEFHEGWMPDNFFGKLVVPALNFKLSDVLDCKTFTNVILNTDALPDIGYCIDGVFYDRQLVPTNIGQLRKTLSRDHDAVYVKGDGSLRGKDVIKIRTDSISEAHFAKFGNFVIQSPIRQHRFFDDMISESVATVRITTVKERDGSVGMRAAYLRVGLKNSSWVEAENSLRIAIVDDEGHIDSCCYDPDWRLWEHHPDTKYSFRNQQIPCFSEAVELCVGLHKTIPHVTVIGWDTAIDEQGQIKIMESNGGHTDIKFSEATTGPCFLGLNWERFKENP